MKTRSGSIYSFNGSSSYTDSYGEAEASETIKETSIPTSNLKTYDDVKVTYFSETNIIVLPFSKYFIKKDLVFQKHKNNKIFLLKRFDKF